MKTYRIIALLAVRDDGESPDFVPVDESRPYHSMDVQESDISSDISHEDMPGVLVFIPTKGPAKLVKRLGKDGLSEIVHADMQRASIHSFRKGKEASLALLKGEAVD